MFCAEGYCTINEVRNSVSDFSWRPKENERLTISDAFEAFVLDAILDRDALRLCSPEGRIFKIEDSIVDWFEIDESLERLVFQHSTFADISSNLIFKKHSEHLKILGKLLLGDGLGFRCISSESTTQFHYKH